MNDALQADENIKVAPDSIILYFEKTDKSEMKNNKVL